ncbi:hypothetical protein [uncultured Polaribacter sp.]|uniref:hypothetical protein n=1 Tax=uncultured Polaribacter sp. TaxID=174711 RepID=UPI002610D31B|nr:hypothetical protein [uncultured Polaribacter sp.]
MKHKLYKHSITLITIAFFNITFAQKFNKQFTEKFDVNKDVVVAINSTNTDINVSTWNKSEVQVKAFIEIEGLSKEESEKYFENWNFEALGNSKKVNITSKGNFSLGSKTDFIFFNDADFTFPDIELLNTDIIVLPEMNFNFNFDELLEDLGELEEHIGENGKYDFTWKMGNDKIIIKSKKEWENFKKSKKYQEFQKEMLKNKEKLRKEFIVSKDKMKQELAKAKIEFAKIDKEKIKEKLAKAQAKLKEMKFNFQANGSGKIIIDGKEIKIKKRLEIKVPKNATFDLNTRHCKIKLPNTVASGNVKYGTFNANDLVGGRLTIDYSKVDINHLNACTLFLNNVTDAKIASVTNTTMSNNSSGVRVFKINQNVNLSDKFGELTIDNFHPNFGEFVLNLSQSNATIILGDVFSNYKYQVNRVKLDNQRTKNIKNNSPTNNLIRVNGDYSTIVIK